MRLKLNHILVFLLFFSSLLNVQLAYAQQPVVHAVLFYSPTCPHCHQVINEDLPPLVKQYGDQLDIIGIDVSTEVGLNLYQSAIQRFNIPEDRLGVPTMIVGDTILVGSAEIPQSLPGMIEAGLAAGGVDWPDIPGLKEIMANQPQPSANPSSSQEDPPVPVEQEASKTGMIGMFMQDPVANSVAVVVLLGMLASVFAVGYSYVKGDESKFLSWPNWIVPVLALIGMGVAAYLSYVEITGSEAICGPVGDCNSVQQSRYAHLFGVISVGIMGLIGYALVLVAWIFRQYGPKSWDKPLSLAIWAMAWFGVLFSIYLTFLEPFVIGATCAWCITSAILMTLTLLASTEQAKQALRIEEDEEEMYEDDEEQPVQSVAEGAESL